MLLCAQCQGPARDNGGHNVGVSGAWAHPAATPDMDTPDTHRLLSKYRISHNVNTRITSGHMIVSGSSYGQTIGER